MLDLIRITVAVLCLAVLWLVASGVFSEVEK